MAKGDNVHVNIGLGQGIMAQMSFTPRDADAIISLSRKVVIRVLGASGPEVQEALRGLRDAIGEERW